MADIIQYCSLFSCVFAMNVVSYQFLMLYVIYCKMRNFKSIFKLKIKKSKSGKHEGMGLCILLQFNISYPLNGGQKTYEIDDDKKCSVFFDRRMGAQIEADQLGDEFKGYVFKITGGNDKQGFPMRQGVLHKGTLAIHSLFSRKSTDPDEKGTKGLQTQEIR